MVIAICDDNKIFVKDTLTKLKTLLDEDTEYFVFFSGEELLASSQEFDYIFLDIEMPGTDGIAVKNLLEAKHYKAKIIFLTNYSERMQDAFGEGVIAFLTKPVDLNELKKIIYKIRKSDNRKYIDFDLGKKHIVVALKDIMFIEAEDKYTYVYTRKGERHCVRKTMREWVDELPADFFCRINRSVIVHYELFNANLERVHLPNGKIAEVSRLQRDKVKKGYTDYLLSLV